MKKYITLFFIIMHLLNKGQSNITNIVTMGDFEGYFDYNNPLFNYEIPTAFCSWTNWPPSDFSPIDPANGDIYYMPWQKFFTNQDGEEPHLFHTKYNNQCATDGLQPGVKSMKLPNTEWGLINPIPDPVAGNTAIAGLYSSFTNRNGIKVQLKEPLKQGYQYYLEFDAMKTTINDPEIKFAFGTSSSFNSRVELSTNQQFLKRKISNSAGSSGDNWNHYVIPFTVKDISGYNVCNAPDWLFIYTTFTSLFSREEVVIDNIKIINSCTDACSGTYGIPNPYITGNPHSIGNPFTINGIRNVSKCTLQIYNAAAQNVIWSRVFTHYCFDKLSWDGTNGNGVFVANGAYAYRFIYENDCYKCVISGYFVKVDQYLINSLQTDYYNFGISTSSVGNALTFTNLALVNKFTLDVYNAQNQFVRRLELGDPSNTISFNNLDNTGNLLPSGSYSYTYIVENDCHRQVKNGTFSINGPINTPYLDYSPVSKPYFICGAADNYINNNLPDKYSCCRSFLRLDNPITGGKEQFKSGGDLYANKTKVRPGAEIDFKAANNIVLEPLGGDFIADFGSQFIAEIESCNLGSDGGKLLNSTDTRNDSHLPLSDTISQMVSNQEVSLITNEDLISVFPNPSQGELYVNLTDVIDSDSNMILFLFDITGKELQSKKLSNGIEIINLSGYDNGLYFIKVISDKVNYSTKLLLKK